MSAFLRGANPLPPRLQKLHQRYQRVVGEWERKTLPQDEYEQFRMEADDDAFVCNCGQYCLFG